MLDLHTVLDPPETFQDAVSYLLTAFDEREKGRIRHIREDRELFDSGLIPQVIRSLSLNEANRALRADLRATTAETTAADLLYAVWFVLRFGQATREEE